MLLALLSGFWSLVALLFLSSVPAHAEWVAVERDYFVPGLQTVYVDSDTIRREERLVTMRQLIDFKWMQGSARGPTRFLSTETHKQFDCAEKRLRLLAFTEFSHRLATGLQPVFCSRHRFQPVGVHPAPNLKQAPFILRGCYGAQFNLECLYESRLRCRHGGRIRFSGRRARQACACVPGGIYGDDPLCRWQ